MPRRSGRASARRRTSPRTASILGSTIQCPSRIERRAPALAGDTPVMACMRANLYAARAEQQVSRFQGPCYGRKSSQSAVQGANGQTSRIQTKRPLAQTAAVVGKTNKVRTMLLALACRVGLGEERCPYHSPEWLCGRLRHSTGLLQRPGGCLRRSVVPRLSVCQLDLATSLPWAGV